MSSAFERLISELKANRQKAALLGLLLCVAAWFWAPILFKSSPPTPTVATPASTPAAAPVAAAPIDSGLPPWQEVQEILKSDPLVQPATRRLASDPFIVDLDQFSPPILFAETAPPKKRPVPPKQPPEVMAAEPVEEPPPPLPTSLRLKSTIVGPTEKRALINNRIYSEGDQVLAEGRQFLIAFIGPRHVRLVADGQMYDLIIENRFSTYVGDAGRSPSR